MFTICQSCANLGNKLSTTRWKMPTNHQRTVLKEKWKPTANQKLGNNPARTNVDINLSQRVYQGVTRRKQTIYESSSLPLISVALLLGRTRRRRRWRWRCAFFSPRDWWILSTTSAHRGSHLSTQLLSTSALCTHKRLTARFSVFFPLSTGEIVARWYRLRDLGVLAKTQDFVVRLPIVF